MSIAQSLVDYDKDTVTITNVDNLPAGLGARLLLVVESPFDNEYIAKRWLHKLPNNVSPIERIIRFGPLPKL